MRVGCYKWGDRVIRNGVSPDESGVWGCGARIGLGNTWEASQIRSEIRSITRSGRGMEKIAHV